MKQFKFPDALIIIFGISFLIYATSFLISPGEYERQTVDGKEIVTPGTYHKIDAKPLSFTDIFIAPVKGFEKAAKIIAFVLIAGGVFGIINFTGAIHAGIRALINYISRNKYPPILVIPILMTAFSIGGATFGMSEEVLLFVLITVPLAEHFGYDKITGAAIPFIGAGAGFAGAFLNPFTVGIAQGIAGLPTFSGMNYRIIVWAIVTITVILFVMRYAHKIQKQGDFSHKIAPEVESNFTLVHKLSLATLVIVIAAIIWGVNTFGWYIAEISGVFLAAGILISIIARLKLSQITDSFFQGASELVLAALIIGFANGLLYLSEEGKILDSALHAITSNARGLHPAISVQIMFLFQGLLNFFVPSGSGQAAITIPLMAPLSDLLGFSRQTAVLAFQFGDGFFNFIIPTSGVTMGVLSIAKIDYVKWLKWILPLMIILIILSSILLIIPVTLYNWQ